LLFPAPLYKKMYYDGEKIAAKMQLEWVAYGASDVDKAP
jgi:hypothetical protein